MRHFLSAYLYKVAVGAAILILIGLVSADIWLWQRDDGPGPAPGANKGAPGRLQLPGLPPRTTTGGADIGDAGAAMSDTAELEGQQGGVAPSQAEAVQDTATVSDSAELEPRGTGQGFTAGDGATLSDSAELEVQQAQAPAPSGGPGDNASFGDSADLVVRDASGNIKQEATVK